MRLKNEKQMAILLTYELRGLLSLARQRRQSVSISISPSPSTLFLFGLYSDKACLKPARRFDLIFLAQNLSMMRSIAIPGQSQASKWHFDSHGEIFLKFFKHLAPQWTQPINGPFSSTLPVLLPLLLILHYSRPYPTTQHIFTSPSYVW